MPMHARATKQKRHALWPEPKLINGNTTNKKKIISVIINGDNNNDEKEDEHNNNVVLLINMPIKILLIIAS